MPPILNAVGADSSALELPGSVSGIATSIWSVDARWLQRALVQNGFDIAIDGRVGSNTLQAAQDYARLARDTYTPVAASGGSRAMIGTKTYHDLRGSAADPMAVAEAGRTPTPARSTTPSVDLTPVVTSTVQSVGSMVARGVAAALGLAAGFGGVWAFQGGGRKPARARRRRR